MRVVSEMALDNPETMSEGLPYADSWEHISDELRRLDLLIHLAVRKQRNRQSTNPLEQFKGLVVYEEEISSLLSDMSDPLESDSPLSVVGIESRNLIDSLGQLQTKINERRMASLAAGVYLSFPYLSQLFHLNPFEEQCLLMCLAPEIDTRYEKLYAYLQDDVTRKKPSVALVLSLLCNNVRERLEARLAFDPKAPLLKYRLLQMNDYSPEGSVPLLSRFIKLDDRIVNFLLSLSVTDARLDRFARLVFPTPEPSKKTIADDAHIRIISFVRSHFNEIRSAKKSLVF